MDKIYISFMTFEEYLRELERAQTDRQIECINTFQLCWKMLKADYPISQIKHTTAENE